VITLYTFCSNCKRELVSEVIDTEVLVNPCQYCSPSEDNCLTLPTINDFKAMLACQHSLLKHCSVSDNEYGIMSSFMNTMSQKFGYSTWVDAHSSLLDWRKDNG
jgi:hypothetical protein